jgi:1,4-dihydroxy-2-naphthoyl-CoA synthase
MERSPQAIRLLKKSFHAGLWIQLQRDLRNLTGIYGTDELQEGMNAFLEKRSPDYSRFR